MKAKVFVSIVNENYKPSTMMFEKDIHIPYAPVSGSWLNFGEEAYSFKVDYISWNCDFEVLHINMMDLTDPSYSSGLKELGFKQID